MLREPLLAGDLRAQGYARALRFGAQSYKPVERMLRLGLDLRPLPDEPGHADATTPVHGNIRGAGYYH